MFQRDKLKRQRRQEWMDAPGVDPVELDRGLRFIHRVNRFLLYTRATLWHLERFSRAWPPGRRIDIVDLATGTADIPLAILRWADARGLDVHIVGVELHGHTARRAAEAAANDPRLRIVQADAMHPPLDDRSFDYALCSMFLHHLDEGDAVRVLKNMDRLSRRGIIASDLLRCRWAVAWIKLFTLAASPMVRHDAVVSVGQSFSRDEVLCLRAAAGLDYAEYHAHFAHRWMLAGEKAAIGS